MNDIVNKFLLAGVTFMPEMHVRQPGFTYSACRPFTESKERGDSKYICQKELDKAYFKYDMSYGDFKDLPKKKGSDKVLCDKVFYMLKL